MQKFLKDNPKIKDLILNFPFMFFVNAFILFIFYNEILVFYFSFKAISFLQSVLIYYFYTFVKYQLKRFINYPDC